MDDWGSFSFCSGAELLTWGRSYTIYYPFEKVHNLHWDDLHIPSRVILCH